MNTPPDTPTPLTDAQSPVEVFDSAGMPYQADLVPADFARRLERRNAELVGLLKRARDSVEESVNDAVTHDGRIGFEELLRAIVAATQSAKGGEGEE